MSSSENILPSPLTAESWSVNILTPEQIEANLAQYESRYPELFALLDQTGVFAWPYRSPFSGETDTESFQNARLQTGIVVSIAEKLADSLAHAGKISASERDSVIRAAVLHNALKHLEVLWKKELAWVESYSEAWYNILKGKIDKKNVKVWKSDIEVASMMRKVIGHGSLKDFVTMKDGKITLNPERTLPEMIVHIASDMVGAKNPKLDGYTPNIQISSFTDRAEFADFSKVYPFMWKEWFSVSRDWVISAPDVNKVEKNEEIITQNYYAWQVKIYEMICAYIQSQIEPVSEKDPVEFVVALVNTQNMHVQAGIQSAVQHITKP